MITCRDIICGAIFILILIDLMGICASRQQQNKQAEKATQPSPSTQKTFQLSPDKNENMHPFDNAPASKDVLQVLEFHPLHPENSLIDLGLKSFDSDISKRPSQVVENNKHQSFKIPQNQKSMRILPTEQKQNPKQPQNSIKIQEQSKKLKASERTAIQS